MFLALFSQGIWAQYPLGQTFDVSGTYTVPSGFGIQVQIQSWGGGAGGAGNAGSTTSRGGGGAGAYAATTATYLLTSGTYTITIGAGGAINTNGGTTTIMRGATSIMSVNGGVSPSGLTTGGAGGAASPIAGAVAVSKAGGAGGNGATTGTDNNGGGGGGSAATASVNGGVGGNGAGSNVPAGAAGGAGATTGLGGGGKGADGDNTPPSGAGTVVGAGGGGRADDNASTGAVGFHGRVIIAVTGAGPLPIKVYYLNGAKDNNGNTLNWKAECSSTEAIFEIERSDDGRKFATINTIVASQLRCLQPFSYSDNSLIAGTTYYRIKIIDTDGRITYSSIIKLGGSQQKEMMLVGILPNPVSNTAQLNITTIKKDNVELAVISLEGKVMYKNTVQLQAGSSNINIDVSKLSKGTYFVRGVFTDGQTNSIKFIKQ
ncbi:MAG: hypothetical protein RIS73_1434, partial [Bacteroidota bacterium]